MFKTIIHKFSKKSPQLGLDMGTAHIKTLQLSATQHGYRVENYAIQSVGPDPQSAIATAMNKFASPASAIIAVADSEVINKIINLPAALNADQIYDLLRAEAEQYFTSVVEELCFDFQVLGPNSNDALTLDILLIAAHKNYIDKQVNAAQSAGCVVKVVDVQSHAIERVFSLITTESVHVVVDIGLRHLLVLVMENKNIIFTHSELIPHTTATFSQQDMVLAITRALQIFYAKQPQINIQQLFLIGGTVHIPDFIELLTVHLKIKVIATNPFLNMELNPDLSKDYLYQYAPDLVLSCGLALRAFQNNRRKI